MIIKQPDDEVALDSLLLLVNSAVERIENCKSKNHSFLALTYISSYIISRSGIRARTKGRSSFTRLSLMDAIYREANYCPEEFVCIVRTSSSTRFGKSTRLSILQKEAIDELRKYCYVKVYDRNAFDNHAKFVLIYHFCFTEKVFYHGRYFGSTNLTTKGLSSYGASRRGNYEEFVSTRLRPFTFSPHTRYKGHRYYISDAKRVLDEKIGLYNPSCLRDYIEEHKKKILDLVDHISQIIRHTPIRELFHAYVLSQDLYLQTLAFLDELPGKELTSNIIEKTKKTVSEAIEEKMEFPDPLEIEMLATDDEEIMYRTVKLLGLTEEGLKKEIGKYLKAIKVALSYLSDYYHKLEEIKEYYDEAEREFVRRLEKYGQEHLKKLGSVLYYLLEGY